MCAVASGGLMLWLVRDRSVTEWDDAALMTIFCRRLKDNVKNKLMQDGASIKNLSTLIEWAIDLDDRLYKQAMEKRHAGDCQEWADLYSGYNWGHNKRLINTPHYDLMEIDATLWRNRKNPRKKQSSKKEKKCYTYSKLGYFAKNYHSKNMVPRQRFNATPKKTEEWKEIKIWEKNNQKLSIALEVVSKDDNFCVIKDLKHF